MTELRTSEALNILQAAYELQFAKEVELRKLRIEVTKEDRGETSLQTFDRTRVTKIGVFQRLKEVRRVVDWCNEEIRLLNLLKVDANINEEIRSLAAAIGVSNVE